MKNSEKRRSQPFYLNLMEGYVMINNLNKMRLNPAEKRKQKQDENVRRKSNKEEFKKQDQNVKENDSINKIKKDQEQ